MSEAVLNTNTLPPLIREKFNTQKIIIKSHESGVLLLPLNDITSQRGIARGSTYTTATVLANRREDCAKEKGYLL